VLAAASSSCEGAAAASCEDCSPRLRLLLPGCETAVAVDRRTFNCESFQPAGYIDGAPSLCREGFAGLQAHLAGMIYNQGCGEARGEGERCHGRRLHGHGCGGAGSGKTDSVPSQADRATTVIGLELFRASDYRQVRRACSLTTRYAKQHAEVEVLHVAVAQ
jgi:hypothetical protein